MHPASESTPAIYLFQRGKVIRLELEITMMLASVWSNSCLEPRFFGGEMRRDDSILYDNENQRDNSNLWIVEDGYSVEVWESEGGED
jgi:hypothetical protein